MNLRAIELRQWNLATQLDIKTSVVFSYKLASRPKPFYLLDQVLISSTMLVTIQDFLHLPLFFFIDNN